ncbi:hypothetical protein TNCV_4293961 [Trichonephila clavipes]|uniref:Uncharacterized protein n=1 Tax=Trichonephila clavipes TaxID=2585209 RepID=A0A8X6UVI6_TRICX|nr:hypothetical protein TNCV_4293961 [Trichonephila clavipes]
MGAFEESCFATLLDSYEDLVDRMSEAAASAHEIPGIFEYVHQSLQRRCQACIAIGGHNLEQLLKYGGTDIVRTIKASRIRWLGHLYRYADALPIKKSLVYADKPQTLDHLEDNIRRVIADIRPQMLEKVIENWTSRLDYIRASRGSPMPEIIFKM